MLIGMLSWSNTKYRFTFGLGSLATAAVMAELWKPVLPIWVMMVIALLPLVVFVFVHPEEMPARIVRAAHVFASAWYVATTMALAIGLFLAPEMPKTWLIYPPLVAAGLIPATMVLSQAVRGRYRLPHEHPFDDHPLDAVSPRTWHPIDPAQRSEPAIPSPIQLPLTLRPSLTRTTRLLLLSALFVAGGIWMTRSGNPWGYPAAGFFGLCMVVFAAQFHPKAAYLRLSEHDFTICSLFRRHTVRWDQVSAFAMIQVGPNRMIGWDLAPEHARTGLAHTLSKALAGHQAALPDTYGMKPEELLMLMESLHQRFAADQNT